jgi:uncharacterized protein (TIGR03435 family)
MSLGGNVKGDRFTATNVTLIQLLQNAYNIQEFQISGHPDWAGTDRYDVEAKMEQGGRPEEWPQMLQALLADRFKLSVHREQRLTTVYSLVVAKNGHKLKLTDQSRCATAGNCGMSATPVSIVGGNITMPRLATRLARSIGVIVIDSTGLSGAFDIKLEWPQDEQFTSPGASANASIYAAIQEQLGLRLESTRAPVETLVIDHAEKPADN